MSTNNELRITLFTLYALAASVPSSAGTWGTQAVLASDAYNGSVAIDSSGNLTSAWYQNALPNGTAVNEICGVRSPLVNARKHIGTDWCRFG